MRRILILLFSVSILPAFSQVNIRLQKIIREADSVVLVSNRCDEPEATIILEGQPLPPKSEEIQLVTAKNKLDYRAVIERRTLTATEQRKLSDIIIQLKPGSNPGRKCIPIYKHTIIIYNGHTPSWIQICFRCFQAEASANLLKPFGYNDQLLAKIWELYKSKGITYELPDAKYVKRFLKD